MTRGHDAREISAEADRGKLRIALALIVGFMAVEVVVGILVSSLALLSDAAHMLSDAVALALSLVAIRLARRPSGGSYTFGWQRAGILSAQFNGATLLVLGVLIVFEGIRRIIDPPGVEGGVVLVVALLGIVVNLIAVRVLAQANRESLNVEGSYQHLLTDLLAFVFTAIAGFVILITGFDEADGIASLVIAAIMIQAAYGLLRESGRVFLEAAPRGLDPDEIGGVDGRASRACTRSTTCTSGRSPPDSPPSPPTSRSTRTPTATRSASRSSTSSTSASSSTTRPSRWTTATRRAAAGRGAVTQPP